MLNEQIPGDDDELPDHDFDIVQHTGCDYEDNGKGLQLDVEKILGTSQREVSTNFKVELGCFQLATFCFRALILCLNMATLDLLATMLLMNRW